MNPPPLPPPSSPQRHMSLPAAHTRTPSIQHQHREMRSSKPPLKWIDDDHYCTTVLQLPRQTKEPEIDRRLKQEADDLDISSLQLVTDIDGITASFSATTVASDPTNQSSILSHSTASTSCSSSEHRPITSSTQRSETVPVSPVTPSILVDMEKKRKSGFRDGIRKMAGFSRKRKSPTSASLKLGGRGSTSTTEMGDSPMSPKDPEIQSIDFELGGSNNSLPPKSPSIRSNKSSSVWSNKISATTKSSYDNVDALIDHDALQRTMESAEMVALRNKQLEERQRFLEYQSRLLGQIRLERDQIKGQKRRLHEQIMQEQLEKNDKAVEDLESRQLEDELKMVQDHESEKRSILARLRHMEAYCQTPSPPPTPVEFNFPGSDQASSPTHPARESVDSGAGIPTLPERKVTDKDYHNLASCYRERDAMDNLHASKINVLRGKQKRAVENFVLKKEKDIERLEIQQTKEIDEVDREFGVKEAECRAEFWEKKQVLERRWKLQAMIEKVRREKVTGLKYELLPILVLSEYDRTHECGIAR